MSDTKRPDFMPEVRQFSQADQRVVQRPEGLGGPGDEAVNRSDVPIGIVKYAEIQASPGSWWENHLSTFAPLATVGGMVLLCDSPLGFPAHSVLVDNWSNQWLEIDGVRRAIPPYSGGWVLNSVSGTQQARVRLKVPSTAIVQAAALTGEYVWVGFAEALLPPMTGISLPGGAAGGGLLGTVRIQDGSGVTLGNISSYQGDGATFGTFLIVNAALEVFNGVTWDRVRSTSAANLAAQSGLGATLVGPPGEWDTAPSTPAIGAQASTSRAAGAAGVRHIARRVAFGFSSQAILAGVATVVFNLRDGATGAGTILKSWIFDLPAAIIQPFSVNFEVNSVGSAATAMTLETVAAVAGLRVFTNLSGYDAS